MMTCDPNIDSRNSTVRILINIMIKILPTRITTCYSYTVYSLSGYLCWSSTVLFAGERSPGEVGAGGGPAEGAPDRARQGGRQTSDLLHRGPGQGAPRPCGSGTDRGTRDFQDSVVIHPFSLRSPVVTRTNLDFLPEIFLFGIDWKITF